MFVVYGEVDVVVDFVYVLVGEGDWCVEVVGVVFVGEIVFEDCYFDVVVECCFEC